MIGFKIIGAQAKNTSSNVRLKRRLRSKPSISARPLIISPKHRHKTRAQFTHSKGWLYNQPKESVLKENIQFPPIREVGYFLIIVHQLSLINRLTIRKENLSPNGRNIVSSSNNERYHSVSSFNSENYHNHPL